MSWIICLENVGQGHWFEVILEDTDTEAENQEEGSVAASPTPDGVEIGSETDPDFVEVSEMLKEDEPKREMAEPTETPEAVESVDYVPYLENISVQLGVLDICLVLYLLIWIIRQFVRVPK